MSGVPARSRPIYAQTIRAVKFSGAGGGVLPCSLRLVYNQSLSARTERRGIPQVILKGSCL